MNKINKTIVPAPVRKSVRVGAPPERAFAIFTDGMGRWWPKSHHIGAADLDALVIEPKAGGRWYERGVDGSECEVGKVLVFEPPTRLVLVRHAVTEQTAEQRCQVHRADVEAEDLEGEGLRRQRSREQFDSGPERSETDDMLDVPGQQ